jgi:hypothetical protein
MRLRASCFYRMYARGMCPSQLVQGQTCLRYALGTVCFILVRHATNRPGKIVRHFAVRNPVRPSSISYVLPVHHLVVVAYIRETRANLADVANLTHFPTLTNTARLDRTWSAAQDECDQTDPTQGSHLPVRVRRPRLFPLSSGVLILLLLLQLSFVAYKIGTADNTAVEGSSSGCPPPV